MISKFGITDSGIIQIFLPSLVGDYEKIFEFNSVRNALTTIIKHELASSIRKLKKKKVLHFPQPSLNVVFTTIKPPGLELCQ